MARSPGGGAFGSRARGDHRPDSDWDVAFITAVEGDDIVAVPEGLPFGSLPNTVRCLAIPEVLTRRKAFAIGHVARGIVRDGRVLAGAWRRPERREPRIQADEYGQLVLNALTFAAYAAKIFPISAGAASGRMTPRRAIISPPTAPMPPSIWPRPCSGAMASIMRGRMTSRDSPHRPGRRGSRSWPGP